MTLEEDCTCKRDQKLKRQFLVSVRDESYCLIYKQISHTQEEALQWVSTCIDAYLTDNKLGSITLTVTRRRDEGNG